MPEFGAQLHQQCFWDWKPYYLNYERLKGWIQELESSSSEQAYRVFYEELESSLKRVDHFYLAQENQVEEAARALLQGPLRPRAAEDLDSAEEQSKAARAMLESIEKLRTFAEQNREGFRKITKKFDKNIKLLAESDFAFCLPEEGLQEKMLKVVQSYPFADADRRLGPIKEAVEKRERGLSAATPILLPMLTPRRSRPSLGAPLLPLPRRRARRLAARAGLAAWGHAGLLAVTGSVALLAWAGPSARLTAPSYVVVWVTGVVLTLLVRQCAPDAVLVAATLFLTVCGILTQEAAWAAFSNDVVLSVAGLGVVASAVEKTGVIDALFGLFLGRPHSFAVAMLRLFVPSVLLNVCISNTCVMSCLLPVVDRWSKEIGFHRALFLMPLSYVLLISGTFAVFSTSTNLIAQGLLISHGEPGFDNFALALPAAACTLVTTLYLVLATPVLLSRFKGAREEDEAQEAQPALSRREQNRYDVRVQVTGRALEGQSLASSGLVDKLAGGVRDVRSCERYGSHLSLVTPELALKRDDVLWLRTSMDGIVNLFLTPGVMFLPLNLADDSATLDPSTRDLLEAVLDRDSQLIGHRLGDGKKYRPEFDCPIVAFRGFNNEQCVDIQSADTRRDQEPGATPETRLEPGDHIILNAPTSFYAAFKDSGDFVVLRKISVAEGDGAEVRDPSKAIVAGCILLGLIALVSTSTLPLLEAVLVALAALMLADCTSMDSIVRAVRLRTILTIVGAFGLGRAIGQEGVATVLAEMLIFVLAPFGQRGLLIAIFAATVALGVIFHGTAVVVLMFPICQEVASDTGMPIHQLVAVLCLAVSCQMLSPISYQTNLMAYSTGGYNFADFTKVGTGLVICIAAVAIPMCEHAFPA